MQKLKYFMAVVENGTLSKAAIALNMTQPPLSILIKKFEEELGLQLFERKGKRLNLTSSGSLLYEKGKELITSTEAIIQELHEHQDGKRGHVTIGCSTIANLSIIPLVVERMIERGIQITVHVMEGNSAYVLEQLRNYKMDIGIIRNVFNKEDLYTTALLIEPILVALPPNHPLAAKQSIDLIELANENFLMQYTTLGYGISDMIIEGCQTNGFKPNIIYWGTETLPMLNMVKKGLGIAFTPMLFSKQNDFILPPLVSLKNPSLYTNLNLVTLKDSVKKAATEQFLEITKEVIEELNSSF
ncbi:LysR family transcriptional regulator [Neobacillus kokaensis]|nr:LysR family transcriptional regulator [Neobacillus kokaensis]